MRKIINKTVILIFILVLLFLSWIIFTKFYYATSNRNENSAVQIVKEIYKAEIRLKPKFGRYLNLEEIIKENALSSELTNGEYEGYKFKIELADEKFLIQAIPLTNGDGEAFSMNEKGNIQR